MRINGAVIQTTGWIAEKRLSTVVLAIATIFLLVISAGAFSYLAFTEVANSGEMPPGVSVAGVDVSHLSREDAVSKCKNSLAEVSEKPLTIKVDDEEYKITPAEIGLELDFKKMVEEAYRRGWSVNPAERLLRRLINRPKKINVWLMANKDNEALKAFVERALAHINRPPHNAYVDVTSGEPVIVPAKDGRYADFDDVYEAAGRAICTKGRTVEVIVGRTPAEINDSVFGKLIVINLAAHTLTLYEREKPLARYPVACGSPAYPSPPGIWKIVSKQKNPAWRNPGTAWAASMPPYIPPGPGNPLGTRALALNASGVLIHGTPSPWSVGRSVSHGCIRMYMRDVEALFEMVEVNTPVYIIKSAGNPGFDVTKTPPYMKTG